MLVELVVEGWGIVVVVLLLDVKLGTGRLSGVLMVPNVGIRVRVAVKVISFSLTDNPSRVLVVALGLLDVCFRVGVSMDVIPVPMADGVETQLGFASIPLVVDAEAGLSVVGVWRRGTRVGIDELVMPLNVVAEFAVLRMVVVPGDADIKDSEPKSVVSVLVIRVDSDEVDSILSLLDITREDDELRMVIFVLVNRDEVGVRLPLLDCSKADELSMVAVVPGTVVEDPKVAGAVLGLMLRLLVIDVEDISGEGDEMGMVAMLLFVGMGNDEEGVTLMAVTVDV